MNTNRVAAALFLFVAAALPASADDAATAQRIDQLQQQVQQLEDRVQALEARLAEGVPINRALKIEPQPGGWHSAANWGYLTKGMMGDEVVRFLGEPDRSKTVNKFEFWYYGDGKAAFYLGRLKSWEVPTQAK